MLPRNVRRWALPLCTLNWGQPAATKQRRPDQEPNRPWGPWLGLPWKSAVLRMSHRFHRTPPEGKVADVVAVCKCCLFPYKHRAKTLFYNFYYNYKKNGNKSICWFTATNIECWFLKFCTHVFILLRIYILTLLHTSTKYGGGVGWLVMLDVHSPRVRRAILGSCFVSQEHWWSSLKWWRLITRRSLALQWCASDCFACSLFPVQAATSVQSTTTTTTSTLVCRLHLHLRNRTPLIPVYGVEHHTSELGQRRRLHEKGGGVLLKRIYTVIKNANKCGITTIHKTRHFFFVFASSDLPFS